MVMEAWKGGQYRLPWEELLSCKLLAMPNVVPLIILLFHVLD
jgi:hypothetical protein